MTPKAAIGFRYSERPISANSGSRETFGDGKQSLLQKGSVLRSRRSVRREEKGTPLQPEFPLSPAILACVTQGQQFSERTTKGPHHAE